MEEKNNQKKEMTLDSLAAMVQNNFIELQIELKKEFKTELSKATKELETKIDEVKLDTEEIRKEIIKKVDIFTHNDLKYRVEKLEKKFA